MKRFCILFLSLFILLGVVSNDARTSVEVHRDWAISKEQQTFLDTLQRDTFLFFWETTNPKNGLTPDRAPDCEFSSVAAVGFALTSYLVGVEKQYITRDQAAERTLNTLAFLLQAPQNPESSGSTGYKGFFYHFLNLETGYRHETTELSTIDTALLMAGVLSSQTYFDRDNETEGKIRAYADLLYRRVEWPWAYSREHKPLLSMGWSPEEGPIKDYWAGYNEAMILYILALGSPTHAIDGSAWDRWTSSYLWANSYGYPHVNFGPLFGHQYSHVWIDFRRIQDHYMRAKGIDYFINSRRATYANRAYCIVNPTKWQGYSDKVWGLTASNGPRKITITRENSPVTFHAYWARGSCFGYTRDDGTVAPTAVGGSVPFAPEITVPSLVYFQFQFGDRLYGKYGLKDAFNLSYQYDSLDSVGWFDNCYLAIDQGPILLMIENYRTQFIWNLMKKNQYIRNGLKQAGFKGGWLDNL